VLSFLLITTNCSDDNEVVSFLPELTTQEVTNFTESSVTITGVITNNGNSEITQKGITWSTTTVDPDLKDNKTELGKGSKSFSSTIENLKAGTTYYARAYATNNVGTNYGKTILFQTHSDTIKLVTSNAIEITEVSAKIGGTIINNDSSKIIEKGICWTTTSLEPTIADNLTKEGAGNDYFISELTELQSGTTYYARLYVTTVDGINYGNTILFQTELTLSNQNKDALLLPSIQYFLRNYENNLYYDIFHTDLKNILEFKINSYPGTKKRGYRITPTNLTDISSTAELKDDFGNIIETKKFTSKISDETKTNPINLLLIGNSLTQEGVYPFKIKEESKGITFLGTRRGSTRYSTNFPNREGKGGWTLTRFINDKYSTSGQSPFVHPVDPYTYYGETKFWHEVLKPYPSYGYEDYGDIASELGFDSLTGLKKSPNINDVMYFSQSAENVYKRYNGVNWVEIDENTLNFSFNVSKYKSTYKIATPDLVSVMLGINDFIFYENQEAVRNEFYLRWKKNLETMINGFKNDNASVDFVICLNGVGAGQSGWTSTTQTKEKYDLAQKELRKLLIKHFDNRTRENIYLVDTGASLDPIYGYPSTTDLPFQGYTGDSTILKVTDNVHPSSDGYGQIGIKLLAIIQKLR
jgi:lysophospholipase L1-like esterase